MHALLCLIKDFQEKKPCALFNRNEELILSKNFVDDVKTLAKQLSSSSQQSWALCYQKSYEFSVALFALLHCDKRPILLPNNQPGTINHFANEYDALLSEDESTPSLSNHKENTIKNVLDENQTITLFTSGSSGQPKKISCTLNQLMSEIEVLEQTFGDTLKNSLVFSTVTHQHIYGLLFTILWPLCAERIIAIPELHYPDNIEKTVRLHDRVILVSSPALLSRLPKYKINSRHLTIFSSGSLLSKNAATNIFQALDVHPIEILGSTETGGVAFRQQLINNQWTPFDKVKIEIDQTTQCLKVQSPYCHNDDEVIMGDRAKINQDGSFQLFGRADRIVKIEDKRASLTEIENRLEENTLIKKAYAFSMEANRQYIAAVLVLTSEGKSILKTKGKLFLNTALQNSLSQHFDLILVPKQFRYVDKTPTNKQGKFVISEMRKLFNVSLEKNKHPIVIKQTQSDDNNVSLELFIPKEIVFFNGHFPGSPILPGVAQVDWVILFANQIFNIKKEQLIHIEQVKFTKVIKPESSLKLSLKLDGDKLTFKYYYNDITYSSGKIKVGS